MQKFLILAVLMSYVAPTAIAANVDDPDEAHRQALVESTDRQAREAFQSAQTLKRENRFNEARREFESLAVNKEPGAERWADLAADELAYGLLLHEANYWTLRMGGGGNDAEILRTCLANAEQLYQKILELNAGNTERIRDTQARIDQLYVSRQAVNNAGNAQALSHLSRLRQYMDVYFQERGEWPSQADVAAELQATLKLVRQPSKRFLIKDYLKSGKGYYITLMDTAGGPNIKLTGDVNGSRIESTPSQ